MQDFVCNSRDKIVPLQRKEKSTTRDVGLEAFLILFSCGFVPFLSRPGFVSRNKILQVVGLQRVASSKKHKNALTTSNHQKDPLILGMTCALWTDDGVTERMIDRRLFPRILALAEQMWYQGERLDFTRFHQNILQRKEWFEQMGFEFGPALKSEVKKGYQWD